MALSAVRPQNGSAEEKARYERDKKRKEEHPEEFNAKQAPNPVRALGRNAAAAFADAQAKVPPDVEKQLQEAQEELATATRAAAINLAIARILAEGKELGKDGKPDVDMLETYTGLKDIDADERDEFWDVVRSGAAEKKSFLARLLPGKSNK